MLNGNHDLFKELTSIFSNRYYKAYELSEKHTLAVTLDVMSKTLILDALKEKNMTAIELQRIMNFDVHSIIPLKWILDFSSRFGALSKTKMHDNIYYYFDNNLPNLDIHDLARKILEIDSSFKVSIDLIESVARYYPAFLKGEKNGFDILFSEHCKDVWFEYFDNSFNGYRVFNEVSALMLYRIISKKDSLRILELGGGVGGATEIILKKLKNSGNIKKLKEFTFSDISPLFLRTGNKKLMTIDDDLSYSLRKIDFNKSLVNQGVKENSIDIVYGINTFHVAKDLIETLKKVKEVIKIGGSLVVAELVRPSDNKMLFQEIIFNLLDSYRDVKIDPKYRPMPGFLSKKNWEDILKEAGFNEVESFTNACCSQNFHEDIAMAMRGVK